MFKSHDEYRAAWNGAYATDPKVPVNLDIELASLCNLACPFCFWGEADFNKEMLKHSDDGKPKKRLMPTELAIRLIDEAAAMGIPALKFNWRGESTMHPDYSLILQHAARKRSVWREGVHEVWGKSFYELLVNTNANCKGHALDGLMAATKVMISLDSTIPEIYKVMRVNGRLERAVEVGNELIRREHPNLWFRRVMTKENAHEPFAENVHKIFGGKGYRVSEHHCVDRSTDSTHSRDNPDNYARTYCGYPSQRIMVAADGTCYPCCVDYDGTMRVGDAGKQSLQEIWDGAPMVALREELRRNHFTSQACKTCTSWMSYRAPQREQVQDKAIEAAQV